MKFIVYVLIGAALLALLPLFAGSYTNGKTPSAGIYKLEFDAATGKLTPHGPAAKLQNPSFLAVHPSGKFLYAVNEVDKLDGEKGGGVTAMAIRARRATK